jgi:flagellar protein FliL
MVQGKLPRPGISSGTGKGQGYAMADDTMDQGAEYAEGGAGRGRRRLPLFIGLGVLLVLIASGAGLYFSGIAQILLNKHQEAGKSDAPPPPKEAMFYDGIPDMLVNLNTGGRKSNFLKIKVSLQIENKDDIPKLQAVQPRVIDTFQSYLRELRLEDLKGSAGLYRLREELLLRINAAVSPAKIDDVLFQEMLVQ